MQKLKTLAAQRVALRVRVPSYVALAVAAACTAPVTLAGNNAASPAPVQMAMASLHDVVVTATRTPSRVDETIADVTVIAREQLETMAPGRSLGDVLQRWAGVQLGSNGGRGALQSIFVRGTSTGQTLLLVDGVRYGSVTAGTPVLESLPIELIERIEVVKGPMSALYGSEAMGGVIQIFTKQGKGSGRAVLGQAQITAGEHGYRSTHAGLRGEQGAWDYHLHLSRVRERGGSSTNVRSPDHHPDHDPFEQEALTMGLGWDINPQWRVESSWMHSDGQTHYDNGGAHNAYADIGARVASVKLRGHITPQWTSTWFVGHSKDNNDSHDSYFPWHARSTQTEWKWDNQIRTPWGMALAGLEQLEQKVDASSGLSTSQRTVDAVFAGLHGNAGRHTWQLNVRRDDNSQYGDFTSYGASYGLELLDSWHGFASTGKSMRAPSFNDLYYPYMGNPNLTPEHARSHEFGLEWRLDQQHIKLTRYDNRIHDALQFMGSQMENIAGTTRLQGWTLGWQGQHQGWNWAASFDQLSGRDPTNALPQRRARQQWSVNVDKRWGAWTAGANALRVGDRRDTSFDANYNPSPVRLGNYTTLDLHASWQFAPEWTLQARVANVTDRTYETVYGYNQPGRSAFVTLKWQMR